MTSSKILVTFLMLTTAIGSVASARLKIDYKFLIKNGSVSYASYSSYPGTLMENPAISSHAFLGNFAEEIEYSSYPQIAYSSYPISQQPQSQQALVMRAHAICQFLNFRRAYLVHTVSAAASQQDLLTVGQDSNGELVVFPVTVKPMGPTSPTYIDLLGCK